MRIIFVIPIILLSCITMQAQDQIKEGVYSLSGSISYYSFTSKQDGSAYSNNDQSGISLTPTISYFIFDQFELSFNGNYRRSWIKYGNSAESKHTTLGLELGLRYYFPCEKFAPFIGISGLVNWYCDDGQPYSEPYNNYSFIGGVDIFIAESAALEPAIHYSKSETPFEFSSSTLSFGIGVKYFIL